MILAFFAILICAILVWCHRLNKIETSFPPLMTPLFASCHLFWVIQQVCHFVSLGTKIGKKWNPLLINDKVDVSQQWTEIWNESKLTLQRTLTLPIDNLYDKPRYSLLTTEYKKREKQNTRAWAQKCIDDSSNEAAKVLLFTERVACEMCVRDIEKELYFANVRLTWPLSWKMCDRVIRFPVSQIFFATEPW